MPTRFTKTSNVGAKQQKRHWGQWVWARAEAHGYRRQQDLAEAIGCGRTQLSKWTAMERPPKRMRKGFDVALARALNVSPRTLFTDYSDIDPEFDDGSAWVPLGDSYTPWKDTRWVDCLPSERARLLLKLLSEAETREVV